MKKMFLSALACVAFAESSFASNEVVKKNILTITEESNSILDDFKFSESPCQFGITVTTPDGEFLDGFIGIGSEGGTPCINFIAEELHRMRELYPGAIVNVNIVRM
ncbi:hypothetical protein MG290_02310 [Flavobacterium sp. CBA20B-1]|uniref:hypothetical protein n=1 Tax=unclassified Flavobacterium TaxID=196869 RepID=UPI0022247F2D|nr:MULTISPECIES: hypothetical protein [unclassified Flavobacterium]WCM42527.1 hypothetical protein MG290_02310 [Flavobacterium sp. CBA20B-1]